MNTRDRGNIAEDRACEYLRNRGFRIIDRNVYNRFGEIDIIAIESDVFHFIEVKSAPTYEQAVNNISPSKLQKLLRTIHFYLQTKRIDTDYTVDAVIVAEGRVELIENITL